MLQIFRDRGNHSADCSCSEQLGAILGHGGDRPSEAKEEDATSYAAYSFSQHPGYI